eukprot:258143-Amphidinium_carterae.1
MNTERLICTRPRWSTHHNPHTDAKHSPMRTVEPTLAVVDLEAVHLHLSRGVKAKRSARMHHNSQGLSKPGIGITIAAVHNSENSLLSSYSISNRWGAQIARRSQINVVQSQQIDAIKSGYTLIRMP